ncbi:NAD(P)-dependent oxidoreductase [Rhizohabitans arisaemae]|uniref:NAD(P)-dependent oxidoreductase n=1 Tax=Rhizohabitans arisaemae TaxID=2720610 RepID=UPI0024B20B1C|nr:NAD(P)-dependent oxidoreductase [Rhizohabitans arisaemae]
MEQRHRKLAVVGLGGIGGGVARRLLDAGYPTTVYNRTAEKAKSLVQAGATGAATAEEAAASADVVLLSLSDEDAVEEILFGRMARVLKPGTVIVELSTVSPTYARRAAQRLAAIGVRRVEACVIGNPQMARLGELRIFAAGESGDVADVADVLAAMGRHGTLHLGPTGRATAMKLSFNLLLGLQTAGLAEAVAYAEQAGIDRELLLTAVEKSGWRSPVLNFRAEFMRTRRYEPAGFRARLMAKDLGLAVADAELGGLSLPLTERAARRFGDAVAAGRGDKDAAVVVEIPPGSPR